jgi:hypothetical protein
MDKVLDKLWNLKNTSSMEEFSKLNIDECSWLNIKNKNLESLFTKAQNKNV